MFANWKALHLKPRTEKKFAEACDRLGLEYYLPLRSSTRIYQRRKVTFQTPLFPGYVFLDLPPDRKTEVFKTGYALHILPCARPMHLLRQLVMLRKALRVDPELVAVDPITVGEIVRVKTGPMLGFEGAVARVRRKTGRVVLALTIDIVGRAVLLETDASLVERLYDPRTRTHPREERPAITL